ncbi:DUF1080 domain-containing protein [Compostibacter hankyongensis]|uniref:3-keto-alpha-glucoside-1,2-lyase/3-keto-2-hydroxy-glucal hydratase domain-containing protein n=1 Tax=Compostibacter hankyongensis TaxID=1007089 RepID=A0ABP8G9L9_9BACT
MTTMKKIALILASLLCGFFASKAAGSGSVVFTDTLPRTDKAANAWEILFNGSSTDKWTGTNGRPFPSDGWTVKGGRLFLSKQGFGDIITKEKFTDFELVLDFNLTTGANSGIKYFVNKIKDAGSGKTVINGPEYQIIDDYNHPAVKNHVHDVGSTAACYLLYPPENKKLYSAGRWNHVRIIVRGRHVEHWLNGVKVLSYERGSQDFREKVAGTKFKDLVGYGEQPEGHILLTDHGDKVYFRNIKIRRL